jgi:hypothetical protein
MSKVVGFGQCFLHHCFLLIRRAGAGATFSVTDLVRLGCSDARAKAVINCLSKLNKVELQSVAGGTSVCRLKC